MTYGEILTKAIQKAVAGGWTNHNGRPVEDLMTFAEGTDACFIFDHEFAKALWGEETCTCGMGDGKLVHEQGCPALYSNEPHWQFRLQQMVIADDPIKYLGENI